MIEELSLDALFHWILESDDADEIHELVRDYMDEDIIIPVFD